MISCKYQHQCVTCLSDFKSNNRYDLVCYQCAHYSPFDEVNDETMSDCQEA